MIKTNHDSGTVLVVRDKSQLDYDAVKNRFDQPLRRAYGWANGEWAYAYITPMIFIEECIGCSGVGDAMKRLLTAHKGDDF